MAEAVKKIVAIINDAGAVASCYVTKVDRFDKGGGEMVETTPRDVEATPQEIAAYFSAANAVTGEHLRAEQAKTEAAIAETRAVEAKLDKANAILQDIAARAKLIA